MLKKDWHAFFWISLWQAIEYKKYSKLKNRKLQKVLLASTFLFLILLLYIQINRLLNTAEAEKRHFTQSVKLSLDLAASQISEDRQMCSNVEICLKDTSSYFVKRLKRLEWSKVDSIIQGNLDNYDIDLAYDFEIVYADSKYSTNNYQNQEVYSESLDIALQQGSIELRVRFPEKNKFIIERISTMFISSILLILLLMASFIVTYRMYNQELKLAVQTRNFINNMAHEFKTPLASIGFANSRIRNSEEIALSDKLVKYTEIIENEKTKLQGHLSEMLEHACLEHKGAMLKFDRVNVHDILDDVVNQNCTMIEEKKGAIHLDCQATKAVVLGSEKHLYNSFSNIIENACKYSNGNLQIDIKCYNKGELLVTEISDNGIGIDSKDQKLVFDKYYRVPTGDVHNIKGYGIGLSYVKEVVELHNGTVKLSSKKGKGSTFTIILPINRGSLSTKQNA
jgi:two-component system phosphate regulon sensor histidine kinase PhoR